MTRPNRSEIPTLQTRYEIPCGRCPFLYSWKATEWWCRFHMRPSEPTTPGCAVETVFPLHDPPPLDPRHCPVCGIKHLKWECKATYESLHPGSFPPGHPKITAWNRVLTGQITNPRHIAHILSPELFKAATTLRLNALAQQKADAAATATTQNKNTEPNFKAD